MFSSLDQISFKLIILNIFYITNKNLDNLKLFDYIDYT